MNKKETLEKCIWRIAVNNDIRRKKEGYEFMTFSKDSKCYRCTGYNEDCEEYYREPNKI